MKISKIVVSALILTIFGTTRANAQGLSDLLGGNLGNTVSNLIEGVFSSSNLTVADLAGEWTATGPAVCFQSNDFLKKAGGIAAASAVESKIAPYYEKYGLNNSTLTVDNQGNFTLVAGKLPKLTGVITEAGTEKGVFNFNFTILGMKGLSVTAYVQKTSTSMDVMFDASKLTGLITAVSKIANISLLQTASSILQSYDGLCVGFNYKGKSANSTGLGSTLGNILSGFGLGSGTNTNNGTVNTQTQTVVKSESTATPEKKNETPAQSDKISTGLNILRGILGK